MRPGPRPQKVYTGREPYIFVSYARRDSRVVYPMIRRLQAEGYRVWYDKAIRKGDKWADVIRERLQHCCVFLIFMSRAAHKSREVRRECTAAEFREQDIVPVFLNMKPDDLSDDFGILRSLNALFLPEIRKDFDELLKAISRDTRMSDYSQDAESLGMGFLPTIADARNAVGPLNERTRLDRQKAIVKDWAKRRVDRYEVEDVFQLTSAETSALAKLAAKECRARSPADGPVGLLHHPVAIRRSYVAPLRLLSGLVSRFDENWPPIVEAYRRLAGRRSDRIQALHYYFEFCWLSWGPSVETSCLLQDEGNGFMVGHVASGDEANSMPLITTPDVWRRHFLKGDDRTSLFGNRTSGRSLRLDGLQIVNVKKDSFFRLLVRHPLFEAFFSENPIALYLSPEAAKRTPPREEERESPCYSTAYLWLMLEQCRAGTNKPHARLEPGKVLPLFEHANLACHHTLGFLQHCLARKAVHHVLGCASANGKQHGRAGARSGIRYRYATALFDETMAAVLHEEIRRLPPKDRELVQDRLLIPGLKERRTPLDVCRFVDRLLARVRASLPRESSILP